MRRGFLLSKGEAKARQPQTRMDNTESPPSVVPSDIQSKTTTNQSSNIQAVKIKIPSKPIHRQDSPDQGVFPKDVTHLRVTSLPAPRPGERFSLCLLFEGMKEAILASPGFGAPCDHTELAHMGGREGAGLALFASQQFEVGDLIIRERPLMILPRALPQYNMPGQPTATDTLKMFANALPLAHKLMFHNLSNCKPNEDPVKGIADTNALGIGPLPGSYKGECGAVGDLISRVNHSCSPNAHVRFVLEPLVLELRATHPIAKGEEITISYITPLSPRNERQKQLKEMYDFTCTCRSCTLPPNEIKQSDTRRSVVSLARNEQCKDLSQLKAWLNDRSKPDDYLIKRYKQFIEMMEQEGYYYDQVWPVYYQRLCKAYCAIGDARNAREIAKKAAQLSCAFTGHDCGWQAVAENPEGTGWWELRRKNANPE